MYKDKALQRETTKLRVRRYRSNKKALQPDVQPSNGTELDPDRLEEFAPGAIEAIMEMVQPSATKDRLAKARVVLASVVQPKTLQSKSSPLKDDSNNLPRYNPSKHRSGDKVLIFRDGRWLPYLVPNMDSGGQEIPDYY